MSSLIEKLIVFFLISSFGYFLGKRKLLNDNSSNQISNILMKYILPIVIIKSFLSEIDDSKIRLMCYAAVFIIIFLAISVIISEALFDINYPIEKYAIVFNNKGFIGIPLAIAVFGDHDLLPYSITFIIMNIFVWIYGKKLFILDHQFTIKDVFINPSFLGFIIGIFVALLPFKMPIFIHDFLSSLANINTPLAMILLGYFISKQPLKNVFNNKKNWIVAGLRLIALPILAMIILKIMNIDDKIFNSLMILSAACPTAVNITMMADIANQDTAYAAQLVSLNTFLSIFTIPLLMKLGEMWI